MIITEVTGDKRNRLQVTWVTPRRARQGFPAALRAAGGGHHAEQANLQSRAGHAPCSGGFQKALGRSWASLERSLGTSKRRFTEDQVASYNKSLPFELFTSTRPERVHRKRLSETAPGPWQSSG